MDIKECVYLLKNKWDYISGMHGKENEFAQTLSFAIRILERMSEERIREIMKTYYVKKYGVISFSYDKELAKSLLTELTKEEKRW